MFPNQFRELIANCDEARRRTHRLRVVNRAEIKRARFSVIGVYDCDTGVAKRSINPENTHQCIRPWTRKTQPATPKSRLTIQKRRFLVRAEIAAMAIAI